MRSVKVARGVAVQESPPGYRSAVSVVAAGRAAFFGELEADLPANRSALLRADDLTPQFGYVGAHFSGPRALLFGINPGNGPETVSRSATDARMMPALVAFSADPTPVTFVAAQAAYRAECQTWHVWKRHCSEILGAGRLSFDDIAYSNCLPWRTGSNSAFSESVAKKAAVLYAYPLIDELKPSVTIAVGKRAAEILHLGGRPPPGLIVWNRAQAATDAVREERAEAAREIFARIGMK